MEKKYEREMIQNLKSLESSGRFKNKQLYIFGHCDASERIVDFLLERGIAISGIADNNMAKCGTTYRGVSVAPPQEYLVPLKTDVELLIASKHYPTMNRQLMEMGYAGHIHCVVEFNTFSEYSLDDEIFMGKMTRVRRGIFVLKQIREMFPCEHLVVCPYNAMGDVYMALMYLPAYLTKRNTVDYAVIVTGNSCQQTAEIFNVPKLEMLTQDDMDELVQALIFTSQSNSIIAHHDRPYTNWSIRFSNNNKFSMEQHYKVSVYGLDIKTEPIPPRHREHNDAFYFPKGKSVILAPHAKSVVELADAFWMELVRKLKEQGYTILTNVSVDEKPLTGTIPLALKLSDTIAAAEWAGLFIGLRSGLCDVMRHAKCKKIVIYPDCIYSTTNLTIKEFVGIPECDTVNIVYRDSSAIYHEIFNAISEVDRHEGTYSL